MAKNTKRILKKKQIKSRQNKKLKNTIKKAGANIPDVYTITDHNCEVGFFASVDPNHMLGSVVKLVDIPDRPEFPTKCNLCSVLVIKMKEDDGLKHLLNQPSRQGEVLGNNNSHNNHYKNKYLKSFARGFDNLSNNNKKTWAGLRNLHYNLGPEGEKKISELAWKTPNILPLSDIASQLPYTATLPAGLLTLAEVTHNRNGRPWGYDRNKGKKDKLGDDESIPVIETCGVILMDNSENILTFPNLKLKSK